MLGNVKSSIPVQFLGQVWTPMVQRNGALTTNDSPYPKWFPEHDHHVRHTRDINVISRLHDGRAKRSEPSYCTSVPIFVEPTPDNDAVFGATSGTVTFTMKAESPNGPITSFQYQAPSGLICSEVVNDQATCTFTLTEEQMNIEDYSFCYDAVDVLGMVSNRRCLRKGFYWLHFGPKFLVVVGESISSLTKDSTRRSLEQRHQRQLQQQLRPLRLKLLLKRRRQRLLPQLLLQRLHKW